nr:ethylene-responsive transcription factor 3-like [Lolium perenne]
MSEKAKVHHGGLRAGGRQRTEKARPDARKFRGVSQQPSGRYGAQIREFKGKAHTHTWLGTFDNAEDATRAFDAAAVARRGPAAITNFQQPVAVDVQDWEALIAAATLQQMSLAGHGVLLA